MRIYTRGGDKGKPAYMAVSVSIRMTSVLRRMGRWMS